MLLNRVRILAPLFFRSGRLHCPGFNGSFKRGILEHANIFAKFMLLCGRISLGARSPHVIFP